MPPRILIVDDEPAIAETLAYALATEGYAPVCVGLGGSALARLADETFALVVLDVGLPDQSGFDVCRALRRRSDVPVLFLTARSEEIDRVVGLELGADDYVPKPFSPREVVSRIRAILRRSGPHLALQSPGDGFRHDADGARIAYRGQWLNLTRYEYQLLALLLLHPGRVHSRAQLMERVWTDAEDTLERTVDAHIKTLRAKLREIDAAADPILTHRGLGYSLRQGA